MYGQYNESLVSLLNPFGKEITKITIKIDEILGLVKTVESVNQSLTDIQERCHKIDDFVNKFAGYQQNINQKHNSLAKIIEEQEENSINANFSNSQFKLYCLIKGQKYNLNQLIEIAKYISKKNKNIKKPGWQEKRSIKRMIFWFDRNWVSIVPSIDHYIEGTFNSDTESD
ncbi:hypothetical protein TRFO_15740 [Tritrichomonas foetus]|uniref:Uncharacterized protein n=1 Tax=Tritrichomonas foetus TaxID=1144522 RepID=A0A1J4KRP9_9EUKA|nr:hypothetical protein TRFO_15740 [Tritrichomonas foetus]|eukprot:OHT13969.1 hypothetical protein TRFO_15740 [Tritrichomonas foetus]